ncbi:MAG: zinc ribbon domain-containing protein [Verrucomicrobiota bacterium]
MPQRLPPELCPQCGATVPPKARACPECGADELSGWSDEAVYDRLAIPRPDFDYNDYLRKEFGTPEANRSRGISWFWRVVAIGLVGLFLLWWFHIL